MHWPQITTIAIYTADFAITAVKHGEQRGRYSLPVALVGTAIGVAILYFGGFWTN